MLLLLMKFVVLLLLLLDIELFKLVLKFDVVVVCMFVFGKGVPDVGVGWKAPGFNEGIRFIVFSAL